MHEPSRIVSVLPTPNQRRAATRLQEPASVFLYGSRGWKIQVNFQIRNTSNAIRPEIFSIVKE